jgi:hypothetical protein
VTRALFAGLAAALLALAGCGKVGPPVRASDAAKKSAPAPANTDPNAPAKKAPAPEAPK